MRRVIVLIGSVVLTLAACGGDAAQIFSTSADVGASSTDPSPPSTSDASSTTTMVPTSTSTIATTEPLRALSLLDVLVRYDGDDGSGTFQAVVCNRSSLSTVGSVAMSVGGATIGPVPVASVVAGTCVGVSDPAATFDSLGIFGSAPIGLQVTLESNIVQVVDLTVQVDDLVSIPPADELSAYQACLTRGEDGCTGYVRSAPVPGEVMTRLGRVSVIAPELLEPLATFSIYDNLACYEGVERVLGVDGPDTIVQRWNESAWFLAAAGDDGVWRRDMPFEAMEREVVERLPERWPIALSGRCDATTAHEQTHLVIGRSPVPGFINEGLATWMEDPGQSSSDKAARLSCDEMGWTIESPESSPYREDFSDLASFGAADPTLPFYYTGYCFWQYLEAEHGLDTIREILTAATNLRDPRYEYCAPWDGAVLFVRDIVNPILGFDFSTVSARWGVPDDYDGCEGV